jgi:predicted nucleic acid-binding protein
MKHIFMDTNVVIDFLADRRPFSIDAARIFNLAANDNVRIYISAVSYNNIYYVLRQSLSNQATIKLLQDLEDLSEIVNVTGDIIRKSLITDFKDYEDAIQYYSALSIPEIDFIVTRNTKDFKKSSIPVLQPDEALPLIDDIQ